MFGKTEALIQKTARRRMYSGARDRSDTFDHLQFLLLESCSCGFWCLTRVSNYWFLGAVLWPGGGVAYGTNVLHSIVPLGFNAGSAHQQI